MSGGLSKGETNIFCNAKQKEKRSHVTLERGRNYEFECRAVFRCPGLNNGSGMKLNSVLLLVLKLSKKMTSV